MKSLIYILLLPMIILTVKAQAANDCVAILNTMIDQYNFIKHPLPKGKMFCFETQTQMLKPQDEREPVKNFDTKYYFAGDNTVFITPEAEVYASNKYLIKIFKAEKLIFIYSAVGESTKKEFAASMLEANQKIVASFSGAKCTRLSDSTLVFETTSSDSSYINQKILTVNTATNKFSEYTVYTNESNGKKMKVNTNYPKADILPINDLMQSDFISIIYDMDNKIKKEFENFNLIDKRTIK